MNAAPINFRASPPLGTNPAQPQLGTLAELTGLWKGKGFSLAGGPQIDPVDATPFTLDTAGKQKIDIKWPHVSVATLIKQ